VCYSTDLIVIVSTRYSLLATLFHSRSENEIAAGDMPPGGAAEYIGHAARWRQLLFFEQHIVGIIVDIVGIVVGIVVDIQRTALDQETGPGAAVHQRDQLDGPNRQHHGGRQHQRNQHQRNQHQRNQHQRQGS